jgi:glyoxylase-like metal-dependent hydrolase (beta-lactamase superfamily II)
MVASRRWPVTPTVEPDVARLAEARARTGASALNATGRRPSVRSVIPGVFAMLRALVILALFAAAAGAADNPETMAERSQARARAVLDRAVVENGGAEALRAVEVVRVKLSGETHPRLQMTTPAPPFEGGTFQENLLVDLENNRLRLEQKFGGFGFDGNSTIAIVAGQGNVYDHRARTVTPIPAEQATQQQFVQYHRRLPNLLLRQALDRTNSLRYLGEDEFEGRRHEVVTFVMPDTQQVALYVDAATGLVSKYELIFVDSLTGEEASEIIFGDYQKSGQYQVPRSWMNRLAGEVNADYSVQVELNPSVTDESFRVAADGYETVKPVPTTLEESVEKLADGVFVIQNVAGQNQNTLAVGFADYVTAVEAPGSSDGADAVIKRIKQLFPGKPIRYVAMTHHHGDHIGGMRSFIAEGATVITTAANRPVIESMAASKQNDRLGRDPRKPEFLLLENGKQVLEDKTRRLELIDIGPNPHAKEMVIAWLPGERVVFQGDLFFVPNNDAPFGPPQPSTVSFAKKLKELGLPVERIAAVHGRTATITQFEGATATAR